MALYNRIAARTVPLLALVIVTVLATLAVYAAAQGQLRPWFDLTTELYDLGPTPDSWYEPAHLVTRLVTAITFLIVFCAPMAERKKTQPAILLPRCSGLHLFQ